MLINDFYSCHESVHADNELSCRIVFNEEHAIFEGHFPGQPVVPGVCMMEIVKELLQSQFGKSLMLHEARNVKFLQFVTPGMEPSVHIKWKENEASLDVTASMRQGEATLFKLDGSFGTVIF